MSAVAIETSITRVSLSDEGISIALQITAFPTAVIIGEPGPAGPPGPPGTNPKVQVSASDATEGYLVEKIAAGANVVLAVRNSGAAEQLEIAVPGMLGAINTDVPDIGVAQDNAADGYHRRYVADKTLARCRISSASSGAPQIGQLRTRHIGRTAILEIYLRDMLGNEAWQPVVTGQFLRYRPEPDGSLGQLQVRLAGRTWWINVNGGWSDHRGMNSMPLAQHYRVSIGAYPVRLDLQPWEYF